MEYTEHCLVNASPFAQEALLRSYDCLLKLVLLRFLKLRITSHFLWPSLRSLVATGSIEE